MESHCENIAVKIAKYYFAVKIYIYSYDDLSCP